ncbi:DUF6973 domain-containing protein [Chryseobacterium sp. A321]
MRSAIIILFGAIKSLSLKKLVRMFSLGLRYPHYSILGFYATLRTFAITKRLFPKTNSTSGVGNAFRHALWTCLIAMYCSKISSSKKALRYAKVFTDMHEDLFPNHPLETKMDLHNNHVGLHLFEQMLPGIHRQFFETGFFVEKLLEKTKSAQVLTSLTQETTDELVYLAE